MWIYERKLQYPVKIKKADPKLAQMIISQLGGPDGEIGASMRYLNQRYSMPCRSVAGMLTDVGIEDYFCSSYIFNRTTQDSTVHNKKRQYNNITIQPTPTHHKSIKYNTGSLRLQAVACDC